MVIKTFAKVNVGLLVYPPRHDRYHPIRSIFQTVSIYDEIKIKKLKKKLFKLKCSNQNIPCDERNLITKVFRAFENQIPFGLEIILKKNIPTGGGLGGGSSNAAGFLVWLNRTCRWGYSEKKLEKIGTRFGADVPFFIRGGTAFVTGIGEKIRSISKQSFSNFLLIFPNIFVDTARAYRTLDEIESWASHRPTQKTFLKKPVTENSFVLPVLDSNPKLKELADALSSETSQVICMSGSGSTLYFPFKKISEAMIQEKKIKKRFPNLSIFLSKSVPHGSQIQI